jgi:hypothetical protein
VNKAERIFLFIIVAHVTVGALPVFVNEAFSKTEIIIPNDTAETKEYISGRAERNDFITIKHQPTRFYHTHSPQEFIIMNYASSRNTLRGGHRVEAQQEYDAEGRPWIKKEQRKQQQRANKKELKLSYNAAGGYVEYIVAFKHSKRLEAFNAIGGTIRGTASVVRFGLETGGEIYYYDYAGLADEWQELSIPYEAFKGFPVEQAGSIKTFRLMIVGKDQTNPEGTIFFDELKVYKYGDEDRERLKEIMQSEQAEDSEEFIKELYSERETY